MIKKKFDTIVFIGRFQPLHNAHVATLKKAYSLADQVLIVIGSAGEPSTFKNPLSAEQREDILIYAMADIDIPEQNYKIIHQEDCLYSDLKWFTEIQDKITKHTKPTDNIGIIGFEKDSSSFYLKGFPQWEYIEMPLVEHLSSTDIRNLYFIENPNLKFIKGVIPRATFEFLEDKVNSTFRTNIVNERRFVENYKKPYVNLPYPPIFVTTDAVVFQSGHVLMIRRKAFPGNGLLALPGGFVNANTDKSLEDAMIRELREETKIKVPPAILRSSIKETKVFDAIERSTRGRTITHAFNIVLNEVELPKIKASSDAAEAMWIPISQVKRSECYEDHYHIISYFI
jgi:bifunctional NMN adenylyltransferase/nudix hydrolase